MWGRRNVPLTTGTLVPEDARVLKREPGTVIWTEEDPAGGRKVVKMYRRRGRMTEFREEVLGFRAEREHGRLRHLLASGVPCTEPLKWTHGFHPTHGWYEALVTREIVGAVSLDARLRDGPSVDLAALLGVVRRMHECGFLCMTLYARNVLVRRDADGKDRFWISDVPRSRVFPCDIANSRMALVDLRDLSVDLAAAGIPGSAIPWEAYGLDARSMRRLRRPFTQNPRSRSRRRMRDVRTRGRWLLAWVLGV